MATKIYIIGEPEPFYTSSLNALGFPWDTPAHSLVHYPDDLRLSFRAPIYLYEDCGMLFVSDRPLKCCGLLKASRVAK